LPAWPLKNWGTLCGTCNGAANGCLKCHAKGKQAPNEPEVVGKMYCNTCHPDPHK
jgi:hypothetical protein